MLFRRKNAGVREPVWWHLTQTGRSLTSHSEICRLQTRIIPETESNPMNQQQLSRQEAAVRFLMLAAMFVGLAALAGLVWTTRSVFLLMFAGVTFGVFLNGLSHWVAEQIGLGYLASLGVVTLLLLAILGLTGWLLGAKINAQFNQLAETLPDSISKLKSQLQDSEWGRWLLHRASGFSSAEQQKVVARVTGVLGDVLNGFVAVVVIGFVGVYAAVEPKSYLRGITQLVPTTYRDRVREVLAALNHSLCWWLVARIASMAIVGVVTTLGLMLLGVPLALAMGVLAFFLVAIPNLGPVLSAIPAILIAWAHGGFQSAGQVALLYVGIQAIESYLLLPFMQRETVRLSPIASIFGVVFLGTLAGVLGALVAAPMMLTVKVLVRNLYVQDILGENGDDLATS